jgi:hypothetical protein
MSILNPKRDFNIEEDGIQFLFRVPTPGQKIDIDARVARRIGFAKLDSIPDASYWYAVAIEYLTQCISPISPDYKGINWAEIDDYELVSNLYRKCIDKENSFLEELKKKKDDRRTPDNGTDVRPLLDEKSSNFSERDSNSGRSEHLSENNFDGSRHDSRRLQPNQRSTGEETESPSTRRGSSGRVSIK